MLKTTEAHNVRKRREIEATFRVLELIDQLGEQQIETKLGIARTTIWRWKRREAVPSQAVMVALESLAGQTYAMRHDKRWRDWYIGEDAVLYGPGYKYGLTGGDILGLFFLRQMIPNYRRQIEQLKAQLAAAYAELAAVDVAANERAYALGEAPPRATPTPAPKRPLWAFRRRLWCLGGR